MEQAPRRGATRPSLWGAAFTLSPSPENSSHLGKTQDLANDEGYHSMPSIVLSVLGLFSQLILIL